MRQKPFPRELLRCLPFGMFFNVAVSLPPDRLIVTGASEWYGASVLALLGSLNLNWPDHPPVRIYDIGLDAATRDALARVGADVVEVPPFAPHWRKHFTWKIWSWNDAPAREILWIDAGVVILKPLPELFMTVDRVGYFVAPTYRSLLENASEAACEGCGVEPEFRMDKMTLAANIAGFQKPGPVGRVLEDALDFALTERFIAATHPLHRHDQAILSLLMYKHLGEPLMADGLVYAGWESPRHTAEQKVWVHRGGLDPVDQAHFAAHAGCGGEPHEPRVPTPRPPPPRRGIGRFAVDMVARAVGRGPRDLGSPGLDVPYDGIRR